jgi:ribosome biogenesis GTPase
MTRLNGPPPPDPRKPTPGADPLPPEVDDEAELDAEAEGPAPRRRRGQGGKPLPSREKLRIRKNKTVRTRTRDWTRRFLERQDEAVEQAGGEAVSGKGVLARMRVYVPPQQRLAGDADVLDGLVTRIHGATAHVWSAGRAVPCLLRGRLKSFEGRRRTVLAVGDRVRFRPTGAGEGVIEAVLPRRSVLSRADAKHPDREHVVVAGVDQLVIVASMKLPDLRPRLIDRYLVAAVRGDLDPLICLNKIDLDADNERQRWIELYRRLGYRVFGASAETGEGIDELRAGLTGRVSVLAGQSGTGKSTLLNQVQPGLNLRVGEVNPDTHKGRHTTTEVTLLPLDGGGAVVDTPGIRSFGLWDVQPQELEACFIEFIDRVADCKFADCTHRHETGCAVRAAVEAGQIAAERYDSYLGIYESLESGRSDDDRG